MQKNMLNVLSALVSENATSGEILRALRAREGFTLAQMAEITGLQETNLSALENSKIKMTQHYAELCAAALDIHPNLILYPNGVFAETETIREVKKRAAKLKKRRSAVSRTSSAAKTSRKSVAR